MKKIFFLFICLVILSPNIYADQKTIRLICKYSHSIEFDKQKHSRSETSGKELVTVTYTDNGNAVIKKENLKAVFIGTTSDQKIYGETKFELSGSKIEQAITINRYTGAFEITLEYVESDSGLIHYGTCEKVVKRKF